MPWFGQGGKKSKPVQQTELQTQRRNQIEALKHGPLKIQSVNRELCDYVVETLKDVEYRITFPVHDTNVTLIVNLPPQFPQDKPIVKVEPAVRHPWIDQNMIVMGCAGLNSFTVHSSLFSAVQSILEEFATNPPAIAHAPYSPVSRGFPTLFPVVTTNIFNIYPSMPSQTVQSQISETVTTSSQMPQAEDPPPNNSASKDIPDFSQLDIWTAFPDLKNMSHMELMTLTEEEDKILEMIHSLPQVQAYGEVREKMSFQCTQLAKENLSKKPVIEEKKQILRDKYDEFERIRVSFERNQEKQLSLADQFHPSVIQNNLKVSIMEAEEESDKIVEEFLDKKLDIDEFQKSFLDKRTLYHERKFKEEKMNQMYE